MGDPKISSSLPANIPATDVDSVATLPELPSKPEPTGSEVRQVAGNSAETINQPGTETNALTDTIGDYEKTGLRDVVSPFDETDPGIFSDFGAQLAQPAETPAPDGELFNAGVMQFASPIALPNAVKGVVQIKLTAEQAQAKAELEKSPVWTILSDAEKTQVTKNLSKVSGPKLTQELDRMKERFQAIETLSKRPGWSQISTAQQQKIADQILKLSGNQLKAEMTKFGGKFDTIEKMSQHSAWGVLDTDQKAKLSDAVFNLVGDKLNVHVAQTKDRLDALSTLTKESSWKNLDPAHQKTIADHLLKAPNLKQTTENVKQTMDFVASRLP